MVTALQLLYAIPRHAEGVTRVNVGRATASTAFNVIPDTAELEIERWGGTTAIRDFLATKVGRILDGVTTIYDCTYELETLDESLRVDSDPELAARVADIAGEVGGVESVISHDELGANDDATVLMKAAKDCGGTATYIVVGTDPPTAHYTPTFDVDERSLDIGISTLSAIVDRMLLAG